ncbi:filamin-A, partial [Elysia marginata]
YGGLSIALEGPHRSNIDLYHHDERVYTMHYSPHEPGIYILNIRFADEHVP